MVNATLERIAGNADAGSSRQPKASAFTCQPATHPFRNELKMNTNPSSTV
jgi:hypothetical protein